MREPQGNGIQLTEAGRSVAHLIANISYVRVFTTEKTIELDHLEEYIGTYKGYEHGRIRLAVICDKNEIFFSPDELQHPESLTEKLKDIPEGKRIGILALREETGKRVLLRTIEQPNKQLQVER